MMDCCSSLDGRRQTMSTKHMPTHKNSDHEHNDDIWAPASEIAMMGGLTPLGYSEPDHKARIKSKAGGVCVRPTFPDKTVRSCTPHPSPHPSLWITEGHLQYK